jgi:type VI secretion system secreted protein VgrG
VPLNNVGDLLYFTQVPDGSSEHFLARAEIIEGLSQLFSYHLTIQTRTGRPDGKTWIGQPIAFAVMGATNTIRMCAGQVRSFEVQYQNKLYCDYTVEVVPALHTTQLSTNSRIFQKMDVRQVIKLVLKDYPHVIVEDKCKGSYPKRDYLLQYRETDFNFICRLMEEEGIYYYFKYAEGAGRYKHKLILANDVSSYFDGTPAKMSYQRSDVGLTIQQLSTNYSTLTAKRTTRAYDYLAPPKNLQVETPSKIPWADPRAEKYDYPYWYIDVAEGKRQGALFMEEQEAWSVVLEGSTNYPEVVSGGVHEIDDEQLTPSHKKVVIISTHHTVSDPSSDSGDESWHQCSFIAMPSDAVFRPKRSLPRPTIPGTQRAVVVGPKGNEIYTDEHGRIKVQFMWDREGKKDENSTCWIRMMQQWAGPGYGAQWIPRIGHEVLVSFLEGDPDQPVVIGSLYNGANKVPFDLTGRETQSGWRTVSSKGKGKRQEFIFEDKAGSEEIYLYGQRNHRVVFDEDESIKIGKNQANSIGANQSIEVGGNRDIKVQGNQKTSVTGSTDIESLSDVRCSAAAGTVKYSMSSGMFNLEAAMSITLKAGASSINIGWHFHYRHADGAD